MTSGYMWTPTLCAASVTVGASVVGLALGRPDPAVMPSRLASPTPSALPPAAAAVAAAAATRSSDPYLHTRNPSSRGATLAAAEPAVDRSYPSTRSSYDGRTVSGKVRRLSSGGDDIAQQRRTDHERNTLADTDAGAYQPRPHSFVASVRSRGSWMKRLSTLSTTSKESVVPSRPVSPDAALYQASFCGMTADSTIPGFGTDGDASAPILPNKLVKRRPLHHRGNSIGRTSSFVRTLRRPAGSRARSAERESWAQTHNRLSMSMQPDPLPTQRLRQSDMRWKSFFSVKVNQRGAFTKSTDEITEPRGIKRIVPDEGCYPTLISARSVVASKLDVDDFPDYDDDSVFYSSRPPSAFGLESLVMKRDSAEDPQIDLNFAKASSQHDREASPRRSFSLHELLSRKPSRRASITGAANRLAKRAGRRVVSDTNATMSKEQTYGPSRPPSSGRSSRDDTHPYQFDSVTGSVHLSSKANTAEGNEHDMIFLPRSSEPPIFTAVQSHNSPPRIHERTTVAGASAPGLPLQAPLQFPPRRSSYRPANASDRRASFKQASGENEAEPKRERERERGAKARTAFGVTQATKSHPARISSWDRTTESRFETILDESPPKSAVKSQLRQLLPPGMDLRPGRDAPVVIRSDPNEPPSMDSPARAILSSHLADDGSSFLSRASPQSPHPQVRLPSSPPDAAEAPGSGSLAHSDDIDMQEVDDTKWSSVDDDDISEAASELEWADDEQLATPLAFRRTSPQQIQVSSPDNSKCSLDAAVSSPVDTTLLSSTDHTILSSPEDTVLLEETTRKDTKSTLFQYTEKAPLKNSGSSSPPRPRTVHGKKDADRGGRAHKRRAPSGLHIRSQSVPVVPDVAGKRQVTLTNKFGTWGVGSKGVSEDWDKDFDFGDDPTTNSSSNAAEKRMDSMRPMMIPPRIQEHQISVNNNISLVKDFGTLIEDLKSLKPRAVALGLVDSSTDDLYELVDSMIDLADQEAEEIPIDCFSPPSSPGFDMSAFDEPMTRPSRTALRSVSDEPKHDTVLRTPPPARTKRKTVLPTESDVFTSPASQADQSRQATPITTEFVTRPRKDSEAVARSVIEALQKKKSNLEPSVSLQPVPSDRRVQFDTRTLRHIVPYVSMLVRRVKEQIRAAEQLDVDTDSDWDAEPAVKPRPKSLALRERSPNEDSPSSSRRSRVLQPSTSRPNEGSPGIDEVSQRMKIMTVM